LFKRLLSIFALILVFSGIFASVSLLEPTTAELKANQTIELGRAMPGETVAFTIDRKHALGVWTNAQLNKELLPEKWVVSAIKTEEKSIVFTLGIPAQTRLGSQNISLTVKDSGSGLEEKFNLVLFVEEDLISAVLQDARKSAPVNTEICYKLTLFNDSLSAHKVGVSSSLPRYWFSGKEVEINARDSLDVNACVNAMVIGSRDFYFHLDSALFDKRLHSTLASIDVAPTLKGKYSAPLNGFSFFTPTLLPYYLIDSLLSLLS